jgi:predicted N-formylglutamate amidohydrolase
MNSLKRRLLEPDESDPVIIRHADGASPFFLTCDHAGRRIPKTLGDMGLPAAEFDRHIAWDIGMAVVSRLVIDCNRDPTVPSAIPEVSELTPIPANVGISPAERQARIEDVFVPYQAAIAGLLDRRAAEGRETLLVAMHSFTPVFTGFVRPWHVGVLYNRDPGLALILFDLFGKEGDLVVGDNEPYHVSDATDYGIPIHGERRKIPHVEIEIRQDLIADEKAQRAWAERLIRLLPQARRILLSAGTA